MTSGVVDFYVAHEASFYRCVFANGYSGIARYLTNSVADIRQITPQEVADAHAAGLAVHFFYEMNPTVAGYFTFAQGAEDCRQAIDRLRELRAPAGTVVYFTVDAPPSRSPVAVLDEYFNGVESMQTPQITPGLYGFEAHVEYARTRFPAVGKHLAQTYGTRRGKLDLWQHEQTNLCDVSVDISDANTEGWKPKEATVAVPIRDDQSADLVLKPGQVGTIEASYNYGAGPRSIGARKVFGHTPGRRIIELYPPEDIDADETLCLDAEPAVFVVDIALQP